MARDRQDVRRRGRKIFAALRRHGEEQPTPPEQPSTGHRDEPGDRPEAIDLRAPGPDSSPARTDPEPEPGNETEATGPTTGDETQPGTSEETAAAAKAAPTPSAEATARSTGEAEAAESAAGEPTAGTVTAVSDRMAPSDVGAEIVASVTAAPDRDPLARPRIVAIANQKGGVGKTTTAVNLGAALAEMDHRVLVVDLDPQGNATTGLGINARDLEHSVYDVITADTAIEDCIESTSLRNLFLVPATIDLSGAEIELVPAFSRELKLRRALEPVKDDYDFTIVDCPPSLGLLTINGLAAADDLIVPIQCEYYALEGLGQLLRNVSLVRSSLNPTLEVRGIVLTMYDGRTRLAEQVESEVRKHFGPIVYDTVIPRTVRLGEAPSFGQPIIVFDPTSRGATTYRALAQEVSDGTTGRAG